MEFMSGVIAGNGCTLVVEDAVKLALRDRDDRPLKLEPGERVVLFGVIAAKRSKRNRRFLVHEVYVQQQLWGEA